MDPKSFIAALTSRLVERDTSGVLVVSTDPNGAVTYCNAQSIIGRHAVITRNETGRVVWTAYIFGDTMGITDTVGEGRLDDQVVATTCERLAGMLSL